MFQKLLSNQVVQAFLAKIWKRFKQDNPIVAMIIMVVMNGLVAFSVFAPDAGIVLPKWYAAVVLVAMFWNSLNGSSTYEVLEKDKQLKESK